jgi:transcriptional regulator with XRE-family HTH domain
MKEFAARLKLAMKARQVTQVWLAGKIGIAQPSVSLIIRGENNPSDRTVRDICAALRINEAWLRTGAGPMEIETPDTLAAMLAEQYGLSPYAARVINALAHAAAELSEAQFARLAGIVIAEMKKSAPAEDEHIPAERAEALTEAVSPDRADRNEAE